MKKPHIIHRFGLLVILVNLFTAVSIAQEAPRPTPSGPSYDDHEVAIRIVRRSPDQLAAFYLGREFNQASIEQILNTCFITPIIHNKTFEVLWLELENWQFSRDDEQIPRIKRDYWQEKWERSGLPQAHRSTFGWTLMPEVRDLRLDEGVAGSVVLPWQNRPFTLTMKFHTGADKQGPTKIITFKGIECVTDPP